jgi:hypothetical protein
MRAWVTDEHTRGRVARAMDAIRVPVMEVEEERPIAEFPGYFVTNAGRVLSQLRGGMRVMRGDVGEQGHTRVTLRGANGRERRLVHRLVLEAFEGPPPTEEAQACHLDGNAMNNRITNLRWGTQADNWGDRTRHGEFRSYSKLTADQVIEIRRRGEEGESAYSIAKDFPVSDTQIRNILKGAQWVTEPGVDWPLSNCWLGTSVEDQRRADERIPALLATPAAVRFISAEPLLGEVCLLAGPPTELPGGLTHSYSWLHGLSGVLGDDAEAIVKVPKIDWVIVGGESGPGARPCDIGWIRSLVAQCQAAGTAVFVKQMGSAWAEAQKTRRRVEGDESWSRGDRKGGALEEFPADLRIREFPR